MVEIIVAGAAGASPRGSYIVRLKATVRVANFVLFVIVMWRANKAESRAYENDNSPINKFSEPLARPACVHSHSVRARLLCACAVGLGR